MKNNLSSLEEFEAVLEKFSGSIKASIFKFGLEKRGIDPEDVFQEVKIKIWKKYAHEKNVSHHSSYIKRVINSTLIDHLRKARLEEKLIHQAKQRWMLEEIGNHELPAQDNIFWATVGEAADSLLESRRKVVKLFLLNLTIDEISLTLNWSRDKIRNLLYRGLFDLKGKLKEKGIEYEDR